MSVPRNKEERIEHNAKKCVHFNGVQHKTCVAGIAYDSIPKEANHLGHFVCFGEPSEFTCPKFQATGREAALKREEQIAQSIGRTFKARAAIVAKEGTKRGVVGKIDCPVCGKPESLHYSISNYNGHIHAACKTEGCVTWME